MILNHYIEAPPGIMHYSNRENLKMEGWKETGKENDINIRVEGLRKVIESHYWRAKEHLHSIPKRTLKKYFKDSYFPGFELPFRLYCMHWLASNGTRNEIIDPEVVNAFKEKYDLKAVACYYLPFGMTCYREPSERTDSAAISD